MHTVMLDVHDIVPKSLPVTWQDTEECKTFIAEIKANGDVLTPVIVRSFKGFYPVLDNEKSWFAAKYAGLQKITCQIVDFHESQDGTSPPARQSALELLEQGGWTCSFQIRSRGQLLDSRNSASLAGMARDFVAIATKANFYVEIAEPVTHPVNSINHSSRASWEIVLREARWLDPTGFDRLHDQIDSN